MFRDASVHMHGERSGFSRAATLSTLKNPGWVLLAYPGNLVVRYNFSAFITEHNQVDSGD